jgi:hypothetical protein
MRKFRVANSPLESPHEKRHPFGRAATDSGSGDINPVMDIDGPIGQGTQ